MGDFWSLKLAKLEFGEQHIGIIGTAFWSFRHRILQELGTEYWNYRCSVLELVGAGYWSSVGAVYWNWFWL